MKKLTFLIAVGLLACCTDGCAQRKQEPLGIHAQAFKDIAATPDSITPEKVPEKQGKLTPAPVKDDLGNGTKTLLGIGWALSEGYFWSQTKRDRDSSKRNTAVGFLEANRVVAESSGGLSDGKYAAVNLVFDGLMNGAAAAALKKDWSKGKKVAAVVATIAARAFGGLLHQNAARKNERLLKQVVTGR